MRSPADMEFIQIDITNACNMRCSNCTRFCGNHEKVFFMDFDTFKRAVDSMEGFEGVTGLIGGEPTLHPQFEQFAAYMKEKFGKPAGDALLYPQRDFIHNIHTREFDSETVRTRSDGSMYMKKHGAGLWSNMSSTYRRYYEVIQDTFSVEYLNDHLNPSYHQPGLFSRKDLGIPDDKWFELRDKCWIQNTWSATVTPKGAFFCEIAGALDMLFDGPGGWPIEPGWWKRKPEEFTDQLHWCELCGFALEGLTFTRDSQEETDDVSPALYEMLKNTNSPKLKSGHINPVRITNGIIDEDSRPEDRRFVVGDRYIARYEDRFQEKNSVLFNMDCKVSVIDEGEDFGSRLNKAIAWNGTHGSVSGEMGWILLKTNDETVTGDLDRMIGKYIFNPGTLHKGDGYIFFCKAALSLRNIGYDGISRMNSTEDLIRAWDQEKIISVSDTDSKTHLARKSIEEGLRYAIWGAGMLGELFAEMIELSGAAVAAVCDRSQEKIGKPFGDITICSPEQLVDNMDRFDRIIIAHHLRFEEIRKDAVDIGIPESMIMMPFEI